MKKYIIKTAKTVIVLTLLSLNGCILDAFDTLTQNIPYSKEFPLSSSQTSYSNSQTIDLSSSTVYKNYQDKIENIKFIRAEYRTISVDPPNLSGNITITLKDASGNILFSRGLGQLSPSDYIKTPFELKLTSTEIGLINAYLSKLSNRVLIATISISQISPSPYQLVGAIDVVFKMKSKT